MSKKYSVALPDELAEKLENYASVTGVSPTAYLKIALAEFLKASEILKGLELLRDIKEQEGKNGTP